jgi:CBS domain-containing protein
MTPGVARLAVFDAWFERAEMLVRRCTTARDLDTLVRLAPEMHAAVGAMVEADAGGGLIARTLAALNDALTVRVIELTLPRHRLPSAAWCWLAFGSEGRCEQTLVTDQDNGIVFSAADGGEARALRPLLMAGAREINAALAACGFPLCSGGVMAQNPDCCLSVAEWCERFSGWVRTPEPQALLNATIYFDLRALHGDATLADALRARIRHSVVRADAFLHLMSANALSVSPPLGKLREFAAVDGVVDLKKSGTRIFVDAARILGIDAPQGGTVARLRHAVGAGRLAAADGAAAIGAFRHLLRLRLESQCRTLAVAGTPTNLVTPVALDDFDRRVLVEALKQARMLQQRLKIEYCPEG